MSNLEIADVLTQREPGPLFVDDTSAWHASDVIQSIERLRVTLLAAGAPPHPTVVVVLPPGGPLATAALTVMAIGAFAPINPQLKERELVTAMTDLGAHVLITTAHNHEAVRAGRRCGVAIAVAAESNAWQCLQRCDSTSASEHQDVALLLHTSGTTARPKLVGLSVEKMLRSARSISDTLQLTPADRCLNIMPLFHIHGLVGVVLSSLVAGASVQLTSRFEPFAFATQLRNPAVTWTSAVPSAYQPMLDRAAADFVAPSVRFARSSSAPLTARMNEQLEDLLQCPVLNSYGMTEASHQMTSNPLPPADRRFGTVGVSAGSSIAILANGVTNQPGVAGEVVIRGDSVISGYLSPLSANDDAFIDGWFRTGDIGSLDGDGYLTLSGRIKEIINVAGEKVSPYEVESVIRGHPDIRDAVAFARPDRVRGEQVCVAVVCRPGSEPPSTADLRRWVGEQLASYKVPRSVFVVDVVPLGPTGKIQRAKMAEILGLAPGA
jgi:acyl-CoA synthetase (AMP-forming)/AMP-acid ligase II